MHETHLIQPIMDGIIMHAKAEGAKKVLKVRLKIGLMLGIKEGSFRETFKMLVKGTPLEGAELEITYFPASRVEVVSFDIE